MRLLHPSTIGHPEPLANETMPTVRPCGNGMYVIGIGAFEVEFNRDEWRSIKHQIWTIHDSLSRSE